MPKVMISTVPLMSSFRTKRKWLQWHEEASRKMLLWKSFPKGASLRTWHFLLFFANHSSFPKPHPLKKYKKSCHGIVAKYKSHLHILSTYPTSPSLHFIICFERVIIHTPLSHYELKWDNAEACAQHVKRALFISYYYMTVVIIQKLWLTFQLLLSHLEKLRNSFQCLLISFTFSWPTVTFKATSKHCRGAGLAEQQSNWHL